MSLHHGAEHDRAPSAEGREDAQEGRWRRGVFGSSPTPVRTNGSVRDRHWTSRLLHHLGAGTAHSGAGTAAAIALGVWLVVGIVWDFPGWWELVLYSTTAAVTLLMVFVIQHTQARQTTAIQRKLDELIRASTADSSYIAAEEAPDADLEMLAGVSEVERRRAQVGSAHRGAPPRGAWHRR